MRVQYKNDKQTFVTQHYDVCRLSIRIYDSLTPTFKSPAKKKQCIDDQLSTTAESENTANIRSCRFQKVNGNLIFV